MAKLDFTYPDNEIQLLRKDLQTTTEILREIRVATRIKKWVTIFQGLFFITIIVLLIVFYPKLRNDISQVESLINEGSNDLQVATWQLQNVNPFVQKATIILNNVFEIVQELCKASQSCGKIED